MTKSKSEIHYSPVAKILFLASEPRVYEYKGKKSAPQSVAQLQFDLTNPEHAAFIETMRGYDNALQSRISTKDCPANTCRIRFKSGYAPEVVDADGQTITSVWGSAKNGDSLAGRVGYTVKAAANADEGSYVNLCKVQLLVAEFAPKAHAGSIEGVAADPSAVEAARQCLS